MPGGIDVPLLATVASLVVLGLIMVYSSSFIFAQERTGDGFSFLKKQLIFAVLGGFGLIVAAQIPRTIFKKYALLAGVFAIVLLLLVLIPGLGTRVGGAQRWFDLRIFRFQPAEVAKLGMIFFVSFQLNRKQDFIRRFVPAYIAPLTLPMISVCLLLMQPDFGSSALILVTSFILILLSGARIIYFLCVAASAIVGAGILIASSPYRLARFQTFLDPWVDPTGKGFQVLQSMLGLHRGGFWGVGLGNGKEKLFYLPEAHNDFIFAVLAEELGFMGVVGISFAYIFFVYRGFKIAADLSKRNDPMFYSLCVSGITCSLGIQAMINMAVVLGLLPTKGITLPFVSYGGSSLIVNLVMVGILLSMSRKDPNEIV